MSAQQKAGRLAPEVNRILFVRNLPFKITTEEMYDIFGKYGAIRQIRLGNSQDTRGTAFVIYDEIFDAKNACEHLNGFNVANRYLIVLYFNQAKIAKRMDTEEKKKELRRMREKFDVKEEEEA